MLRPSRRLSAFFGNSLRATFQSVTVLIAAMAIAACAAMLVLTTLLQQLTATVADSVESVHHLEEAEIGLLRHSRARDLITKQELESVVRERLGKAHAHATSTREQGLVTDAVQQLDRYFTLANAVDANPREIAVQEQKAFSILETLVEYNVEQSSRAQVLAREWDDLSNAIGIGASVLLLGVVSAAILWVRRRALRPLLSLSDAMERFGSGDVDTRAKEEGPIELREMSARFNEMATAIAAQRDARIAVLGGVAHDLRTPLSALRLGVDTLGADRPLPPEAQIRRVVAIIDRQISRLDRMLGDFLDVSRIEAGSLSLATAEHDATQIVRDVVEVFDTSADRFRVELPDEPVIVRVDNVRLGQVITNLVSNAIKYSPADTSIEIRLSARADEAILEVTDAGIGMAAEDQRLIFEPFRRVGRAQGVPGVGLGLYMARKIVVAHGGSIEVDSSLGRGSTFTLRLPLATRSEHPAAADERNDVAIVTS